MKKTVSYGCVAPYRRNKNLFVSNVEDNPVDKVLRKGMDRLLGAVGWQCHPVLSEQIIEYPLLFRYLAPPPGCILDFGCNEGLLPMQLCALGYTVTGMGLAPYPFTHRNFTFVQADVLNWSLPLAQFDTVTAISSIEHVGLSYSKNLDDDGDRQVIDKLIQTLKPGGKLLLSVPAGKPCSERGMRIYDADRIRALVPGVQVLRFYQKTSRYGDWEETTPENVAGLVYEDYYATSPAQGVAFVVAQPRQ